MDKRFELLEHSAKMPHFEACPILRKNIGVMSRVENKTNIANISTHKGIVSAPCDDGNSFDYKTLLHDGIIS